MASIARLNCTEVAKRTALSLSSKKGSWPLLMIGLASPYPAREPTHPLVAGPGFGPARHLGDRARPIRHHPDPPTPFAHGTLPAVRPTLRSRTQPLRADLGRPALG